MGVSIVGSHISSVGGLGLGPRSPLPISTYYAYFLNLYCILIIVFPTIINQESHLLTSSDGVTGVSAFLSVLTSAFLPSSVSATVSTSSNNFYGFSAGFLEIIYI